MNNLTVPVIPEEMLKEIAKEVVLLNEQRKLENRRIDYMSNKVFEQAKLNWIPKINLRFAGRNCSLLPNGTEMLTCETSDIWNGVEKMALLIIGAKNAREAYLSNKGDMANYYAEKICEMILTH